ncbi:ArsR/SmtB family transcription factor [Xaviernesmea oryzae]|nr:metalloregulator ArsR/SmtB family transcription factor [Xaviernesmea oryzae]
MAKIENIEDQKTAILEVLSHPGRLKMMTLLDGSRSVNQIAELLDMSQSYCSQVLAKMVEYNLVTHRKHKLEAFYTIAPEHQKAIETVIEIARAYARAEID